MREWANARLGRGPLPHGMDWIAVMDRVGGLPAYRELLADARAYDDVLIAMMGEAEAERIRDLERRAHA